MDNTRMHVKLTHTANVKTTVITTGIRHGNILDHNDRKLGISTFNKTIEIITLLVTHNATVSSVYIVN